MKVYNATRREATIEGLEGFKKITTLLLKEGRLMLPWPAAKALFSSNIPQLLMWAKSLLSRVCDKDGMNKFSDIPTVVSY